MSRLVWTTVGLVCVVIGAIGVILPGLPGTIFFILAAGAFARSNPRLEAWVLALPGIGPAVRDFRAGKGMPLRAKVLAVGSIVVFTTLSVVLVDVRWIRLVVIATGLVGLAVILRLPTNRKGA